MKKLLILSSCLLLTACGSSSDDSSDSSSSSANNTGKAYVSNLKFDADILKNRTLYDLYDNSASFPTNYFPFYITIDDASNMQIGDGFNPDYETDYSTFTYSVNSDGYLEINGSSKTGIIKPIKMIDDLSVITEYCDLDENDIETNCETGYLFDSQADAETYINTYATSKTTIDTSGLASDISDALQSKEYSYYEQVRTLDGADAGISDISFIADYQYLEELDLSKNSIEDISALSNLQQVEVLTLYENRVSDITPLNNLTSITSLNIYFQSNEDGELNIADYSSIYTLSSLDALYLSEYGDTTPAAEFNLNTLFSNIDNKDQLKTIHFYSLKLDDTDLLDFSDINHLENLHLVDDEITDFTNLSQSNSWSNLITFELYPTHDDQALFDISDMINNDLTISNMAEFMLHNVTFDNDQLNTLTTYSLSKLEALELVNTDITDFSALANTSLENLEYLALGSWSEDDEINLNFSNLQTITESLMTYLALTDFNSITNFSLEGYENLKSLDLGNSNFTDLTLNDFNNEILKSNKLEEIYLTNIQLDGEDITCSDLNLMEITTCDTW